MANTGKRARARKPAAGRSSIGRGASARTRSRARRRTRRRPGIHSMLPRGLPRLPALDQRQRDVLGLALLAAGVFMGYVLYSSAGPSGGRAGHGLAVALGWSLGKARVLAPPALLLAGGALLARTVLPAIRPLRTGSICLFASITLALSAGTLGLSG